jgi:hypothetical protein
MRQSIRCAARRLMPLPFLLATLSVVMSAGSVSAVTIGDQVELRATHQAGVPFHTAPGGTPKFQRVPGGTVATVIDTA